MPPPIELHELPLGQAIPHELQWFRSFLLKHVPLQQYLPEPHDVPFATDRVHDWFSDPAVLLQLPAAHAYVVFERLRVPVVSHALLNPPHELQAP